MPFVAKVTAMWEDPDDGMCTTVTYDIFPSVKPFYSLSGEMMLSLLWYYRPEHLENGRRPDDLPDEVYASRHRDVTSVACIDDKCYVMTFNEYCR